MKQWLIDHNFIQDKDERAYAESIFDDDETWDAYWRKVSATPAKRWWVDLKSDRNWKPFFIGGDEYMRKVYVFKIPFGPGVCIASEEPAFVYEESPKEFSVTFKAKTMTTGLYKHPAFEDIPGIEVNVNDHGEVVWVDLDTAVLESNYKK